MKHSGIAISVIWLCLGTFLATPCAAKLSTAEIEEILEFDVAVVPDPETVLDAISGRSEYAKVAAQRQALAGIHLALTGLLSDFSIRETRDSELEADIRHFTEQVNVKRTAYLEKMQELQQQIPDAKDWQVPSYTHRLPVLIEFLPQYAELKPGVIAQIRGYADRESAKFTINEREGAIPLLLFAVAGIAGLIIVVKRTIVGLSDKDFQFEVISETGEVMREQQSSETKVSGAISGGGSYNPGMNRPISGSIWSTTTRYQEIFVKMANGKERVLDFVDFKVACRAENMLSLLAVQRPGGTSRGCAIHNHATEETQVFQQDILAAIKPRSTGMPYLGWWLYFVFLSTALAWFGGTDFSEDGLPASIMAASVLGAVPTAIVAVIVSMRSSRKSRQRLPAVKARIDEVIDENERLLTQ